MVLFEILSSETEVLGRGEKWQEHQTLPSLQHYVLIAQDMVPVEHYQRVENGWYYRELSGADAVHELDPPGVKLGLAEFYDGTMPARLAGPS